jgi:hypothetical protein
MAAVLAVILAAVALFMPPGLPKGRAKDEIGRLRSGDPRIDRLSAARLFLFGARDAWFVVGIPVYFYGVLSDGTAEGRREAFFLVGAFMALWIIGYGAVQAAAPALLRAKGKPVAEIARLAAVWAFALALIPAGLAGAAWAAGQGFAAPLGDPALWLTATLIAGLMAFGVVFALNSALHSYLILAFTRAERVTMDVGFYYGANAAGRLLGTLLSGLSYQQGGLPLCLATAAAMALASWACARRLGRQARP